MMLAPPTTSRRTSAQSMHSASSASATMSCARSFVVRHVEQARYYGMSLQPDLRWTKSAPYDFGAID